MRKADTLIINNPGFFAAIGSHLGNALGILLSLVIATIVAFYTLSWLWPTLKWLVPFLAFCLWPVWVIYRSATQTDELAKSHHSFKANVLAASNLIICCIIAANAKLIS